MLSNNNAGHVLLVCMQMISRQTLQNRIGTDRPPLQVGMTSAEMTKPSSQ